MSLNGVITRFAQGVYTVTRSTAGSYVDGYWVVGSTSEINVEANIQPVTGDVLKVLPEGFHSENTRKVYSKSALQAEDESTGTPADLISIDGATWKVIMLQTWARSRSGGDFYKAIVGRVI